MLDVTYRVDLAARAERDLRRIYLTIDAANSARARAWFNRLERVVLSLDEHPERGAMTPEDNRLRQVLHGRKPHAYRIVYGIDEARRTVTVLHIRHGAPDAFQSEGRIDAG